MGWEDRLAGRRIWEGAGAYTTGLRDLGKMEELSLLFSSPSFQIAPTGIGGLQQKVLALSLGFTLTLEWVGGYPLGRGHPGGSHISELMKAQR